MKNFNRIIAFFLISFLIFIFGCSKEDVPTSPNKANSNNLGKADFSSYVSIGNSLTAGYQDGALFEGGQIFAYPNLIAQQVNALGANVDFQKPLISEPGLGARMSITNLDPVLGPTIAINSFTGNPLTLAKNISLARPYNNLGVPGSLLWIPNAGALPLCDVFESVTFLSSTTRNNPLFGLILRSEAYGKNIFNQAKNLKPTFVTAWLGNNDVLGYATSGGTVPPSPTPLAMFSSLYKKMIDSLTSLGANVVVANIPDVTTIPFFTTISIIHPVTKAAMWATTKTGVRQLVAGDYVTLQAKAAMGTGLGATQAGPLPDAVVLDKDEVVIAKNAVNDFNSAIASVCSQAKLKDGGSVPVVDINGFFTQINDKSHPYYVAGELFTTDYVKGGLFGLDGVHPTSKGQGVIANKFIEKINDRFEANIAYVDITKIAGLKIPVSKSSNSSGEFKFTFDKNVNFDELIKLFQ